MAHLSDQPRFSTDQHDSPAVVYAPNMAWVKVPPEHHPVFYAALPKDPRVETVRMFGGVAAKVNGHLFAGLFGRSTMVLLAESDRAAALALEGAAPFDPMGDGRARSDKVMLPERVMSNPAELRQWIARAFRSAALLPVKQGKAAPARKAAVARAIPGKKAAVTRSTAKRSTKKRATRSR